MDDTMSAVDLSAYDRLALPVLAIDTAARYVVFLNRAAAAWLGVDAGREGLLQSGLALADIVLSGAEGTADASGTGDWKLRHASGAVLDARADWRGAKIGAMDVALVTLVPGRGPRQSREPDYRCAFDRGQRKALVVAADDHRIVAANDAFVEATGADRSSLVGTPVAETFPGAANPQDPTGLEQALRRVAVTRTPEALICPGAGGEGKAWIISATPMTDPDGTVDNILLEVAAAPPLDGPTPAIGSGIGLVRAAMRTFDEHAARRRTAEGLLGIGAWDLDVESNKLAWSPKVHEVYGVPWASPAPDFDGYVALVHPDDRAQMLAAYADFAEGRTQKLIFRHRIQRADGSIVHVSGVGERHVIAGREIVTGFVQDVTNFVQTRERLSQMEHLLAMAGSKVRLGGWRAELFPERVIWTPETCAIYDVPPDHQPTIESALESYVPEDRDRISRAFWNCVNDGVEADEIARIVTASGSTLWVRAIAAPVRDERGRIVAAQGAFQDITPLMKARMDAEDANRRYRETLESIGDAFLKLDRDWCFTYANSHAGRMLQRDPETLIGRHVWAEFPEAVGSASQLEYERAVATRETARFETYYPPLDAWFDVSAYPVADGLAIYFRDVTQRKEMEAEARAQRERFELIARAAPDLILDWDMNENRLWANDAITKVFGYAPDEVRSDPVFWQGLVHPEDRDRVGTELARVLGGTDTMWTNEYRFLRADGSYATVLDRGFILRDAGGRAVRMIGSLVDLTERHELERRLDRVQRLEAIGQLTGGVAHDFNNLLTVILGNAEAMTDALTDQQQLQIMADMTAKAAERGAELTNRLLAFARRQPLQPTRVDINRLLKDSEALLRRTISEDVEIEVVRGAGLWPAELDAGQLEVALINLVLNASDALPQGGRITIETANSHLSEDYARAYSEVTPGQYVLVSVSDNGIGMDAETVGRAIEPFFTTKDIGKGSGLGLSMVFGFVKQSNGHLTIYSEPREGTTVRLYFPRAGLRAVAAEAARERADMPGGTEHILIAEDDELVRTHLAAQLASLGYRVTEAANGPDALALLADLDDVAMLLTDIVMPGGLNGRELAERAVAINPGLKVLYTSGYTENAIVHQGRLDPGIDLLSKPYRRKILADKVRTVLDR